MDRGMIARTMTRAVMQLLAIGDSTDIGLLDTGLQSSRASCEEPS